MMIDYKKFRLYFCFALLFLYVLLLYVYGGQIQYTTVYKIPMYIFMFLIFNIRIYVGHSVSLL